VMIGAIVVVFVFWGAGSFRERSPQYVAIVNDEAIGFTEYQEAYRNLYEQARNQYRQIWSDDLVKTLDLKNQALETLINQRLLSQMARSLNLEVTQNELQEGILNSPAFQVDGLFNAGKYRSILARIGFTPESYEILKRRDLTIQQMNRLIISFVKVVPAEVRENYHFTRDRVDVEFILFKAGDFRNKVKTTPEELKDYFEKNKLRYQVPAKVKVAYLAIRPKDLEDQITIEPSEVEEFYEFNLDKYREPEKVKARHILFKVDEAASPDEVARIKTQAELVLKQAKAGEDFATLARKHSQDSTAKEGGELGWMARDQLVKPFSEAAFKLKKGEVSDLVRTQYGFHIIKVEDHREAGIRPLQEVKAEIEKKIISDNARELAADLAVEVYEKASLNQDFKAVIKEYKLTPVFTDFFSINEPVGDLGLQRTFTELAHSLKEGEIGPLVDLPDGHYLIKALEKRDSYIPALDKIKESVRSNLVDEKAGELARKEAVRFLAALGKDGRWDQLTQDFNLSPESTGPFTRIGGIPKIGINETLTAAAFALTQPGQTAPEPYEDDKGFYIIRLKKIIPASEESFEKEQTALTRRLQIIKSQNYLRQWLEDLRARSIIKINEELM
ncbi:MAG: SurA N-terminal domain-containing protein, partial [Deltaproteobacteria bacterium]|nr:SurA N-terminal domain-containing protein [Deltaproteobacteria bacterium]